MAVSLYFSYRMLLQVTIREHTAIFRYTERNKSFSMLPSRCMENWWKNSDTRTRKWGGLVPPVDVFRSHGAVLSKAAFTWKQKYHSGSLWTVAKCTSSEECDKQARGQCHVPFWRESDVEPGSACSEMNSHLNVNAGPPSPTSAGSCHVANSWNVS